MVLQRLSSLKKKSFQLPPLPSHLPELTSVRAIAAFTVVVFHMFFSEQNAPGFFNNLIADGHLGVDFFFMLSGFILTHVYVNQWRGGTFNYAGFLTNRFARVYPLHLAMTLLVLLAYQVGKFIGSDSATIGQNWSHLPFHIFLMHAWGFTDSHSWNFPSWSVSAEAFAYLLFPLILLGCLKVGRLAAMVIGLILFFAASLFAKAVIGHELTKLMYNFGIIRVFVEFTLGVAIYLILERHRLPQPWVRPGIVLCVASVLALSGIQADERLIVLTMAVLLACLAQRASMAQGGILRSRLMIYLGEISYATYMVHILVLFVAKTIGPKLGLTYGEAPLAVLSIIGIYVASAILFHFIEKPWRVIIRRSLMPA